jgi:hypothetical protein
MRFAVCVYIVASVLSLRAQDNPQARPPVSKVDIEIVRRAREILNSPAKWNRADNRICPETATTYSLYCALEKATTEKSGAFEHRGAAMQEARFVIEDVAHDVSRYQHRLMDYNNDPTTTFEDMQKVFRLLEERIAKRIAEGDSAGAGQLNVRVFGSTGQPSAPAPAPPSPPRLVNEKDLEVLQHARVLLDSPAKWDRADRQHCDPASKTVSLFCALQLADKEVNGSFDNSSPAIEEARAIIGELDPKRQKYNARLTDYNNDPAITFADLQKFFQSIEDRLSKRMPPR